MPKIDDGAKTWQQSTATRIGVQVQYIRRRRNMSVAELAERTRDLGYPLHRVAIGKIESGHRGGKLDTVELIILARALGVEPISLLYPDLIDGIVEVTPNRIVKSFEAVNEFCGLDPDAHTSLRTYWDYVDACTREKRYIKQGNADAAYEAQRQAEQSLQQGVAMWNWFVSE